MRLRRRMPVRYYRRFRPELSCSSDSCTPLREAVRILSSTAVAPRARKSFSRLKHVLDLPNLIDIQKASFEWFLNEGLRETIDDISPIEDYTGTLAVEFGDYEFGDPQFTIQECREKDLTYQAPLSMTVRFVNKETGEIREQRVFMGDFPMMTECGTFIINGTERVIVTQLVRSPGRLPDGAEGRDEAGLHREPDAEPRLVARARDRQEGHRLRPHRPEAQAADHDAPARTRPPRTPTTGSSSTRARTRRSSPSSTTRSSSRTRSTRTRPRARKRR